MSELYRFSSISHFVKCHLAPCHSLNLSLVACMPITPQLRSRLCIFISLKNCLAGRRSSKTFIPIPKKLKLTNEGLLLSQKLTGNAKLLKLNCCLISQKALILFRYGEECKQLESKLGHKVDLASQSLVCFVVHSTRYGVKHSESIPWEADSPNLFSWVMLACCVHWSNIYFCSTPWSCWLEPLKHW